MRFPDLTSSKDLPFKSKTYHFFPRMTPITEALEICEKINGTLAIPDNREQEMELGELGAEAFGKLPSMRRLDRPGEAYISANTSV